MERIGPRHTSLALVGALLLSLGGPLGSVAAQGSPSPDAASVADGFALPAAADLAMDATLAIDDVPADPPPDPAATVDPNPELESLDGRLASYPPEAWDVDALAATFEGDPARAFAFVRDAIGFDPYRGVLRGAGGTLAARAGSAADRAILLASLLGTMGLTTRYAFAELDAATSAGLVERSLLPAAAPLAGAGAAEALDGSFLEAISVRARRDHALLVTALSSLVDGLGSEPERDAAADVAHHAWVQLERDGAWVDLDPSLPDAVEGETLAPATSTADAIPDAERAAVTVRVVAENLIDGTVAESVALDQRLDAASVTGATILLGFQPEAGGGLLDMGGGGGPPAAYQPALWIDGSVMLGTPIAVLGSGDSFFGTGSDIRLTRLVIELTSEAPGREPLVHERLLLDRIPDEARAAGTWTADDLLAMPVTDEIPAVMMGVHHLIVSTGGSNPAAALEAAIAGVLVAADDLAADIVPEGLAFGTVLLPLTASNARLALVSEHAIVAGLDSSVAGRTFVGRPRAFLVSMAPDAADPEAIDIMADLALDGIDIVAGMDAGPTSARLRLWYGAAQTALETELILRAARSGDPAGRQLIGVSLAMLEPLTVLIEPSQAAGAPEPLVEAVAGGSIAVVPGDVTTTRTWWTISPSDGEALSILAPAGRAFESLFYPLHWGRSWDPIAQQWVDWYEKTVIRRRCGGGTEYQTVTNCASMNALSAQQLAYVQRVYLDYVRWLVRNGLL